MRAPEDHEGFELLSEDPAEVLDSWDRERTLRELTRFIRLFRPERVITWFPGPVSSHVDHVAAGGAALLACRAAASPEAYPEQMMTEGLRPHRVGGGPGSGLRPGDILGAVRPGLLTAQPS